MDFLIKFYSVFIAMLQIFIIVLCGFLFYRWKLIDKQGISSLTNLTINLFLPALIFSHLIKKFSFTDPRDWWIYPFLGMAICLAGSIVARIYLLIDKKVLQKNEIISVVSFQNCGYLPLILVMSIFSEQDASKLFTYIFLFIQGFNLIFWSFGIQFLSSERKAGFEIKKILNPPFVSLVAAFFIIWFGLKGLIPQNFLRSVELVGGCTLPIALISLGSILSAGCFADPGQYKSPVLIKTVMLKLFVLPVIILGFILLLRLPKYMSILLLIQASMPAAINLSVVSFSQSQKCDFITQAVFLTHLFALITVPLFLSVLSFYISL
jgi:predicted permease